MMLALRFDTFVTALLSQCIKSDCLCTFQLVWWLPETEVVHSVSLATAYHYLIVFTAFCLLLVQVCLILFMQALKRLQPKLYYVVHFILPLRNVEVDVSVEIAFVLTLCLTPWLVLVCLFVSSLPTLT